MKLIISALAIGLFSLSSAFAGASCGGCQTGSASCSMQGAHAAALAPAAETGATAAAEAAPAAKSATVAYPIDYCLVTGEKLGSMGDPVVKTYNGREVKFCCNGCVKKFEANQAAYFEKLDAAVVKAQTASYPVQTCVVSGEKLGEMGAPVDYVYQNRLVRFCCNGCIARFEKDPAKYLSMLDAAAAKTAPEAAPQQH